MSEENNELVVVEGRTGVVETADFMPMLSVEEAGLRYSLMKKLVSDQMIDGVDYGTIPGTSKPTLLKPGAEKLTTFFALRVLFVDEQVTERWDDDNPLFYYRRKCQLWRGDVLIAEASGSANSREDRYRWRWVSAENVPNGDITDLKTKGGRKGMFMWQFEKRQTTGDYGKPEEYYQAIDNKSAKNEVAHFMKEQPWNSEEANYMEWDETLYRVPNEEIFTLVNTVLKMADKRALVAATLIACNASDYFTQDMEDISGAVSQQANLPKDVVNITETTKTKKNNKSSDKPKWHKRMIDRVIEYCHIDNEDEAIKLLDASGLNGKATVTAIENFAKTYQSGIDQEMKHQEALEHARANWQKVGKE